MASLIKPLVDHGEISKACPFQLSSGSHQAQNRTLVSAAGYSAMDRLHPQPSMIKNLSQKSRRGRSDDPEFRAFQAALESYVFPTPTATSSSQASLDNALSLNTHLRNDTVHPASLLIPILSTLPPTPPSMPSPASPTNAHHAMARNRAWNTVVSQQQQQQQQKHQQQQQQKQQLDTLFSLPSHPVDDDTSREAIRQLMQDRLKQKMLANGTLSKKQAANLKRPGTGRGTYACMPKRPIPVTPTVNIKGPSTRHDLSLVTTSKSLSLHGFPPSPLSQDSSGIRGLSVYRTPDEMFTTVNDNSCNKTHIDGTSYIEQYSGSQTMWNSIMSAQYHIGSQPYYPPEYTAYLAEQQQQQQQYRLHLQSQESAALEQLPAFETPEESLCPSTKLGPERPDIYEYEATGDGKSLTGTAAATVPSYGLSNRGGSVGFPKWWALSDNSAADNAQKPWDETL
ncbi:hypothetical protein SeMB42_g06853 [Synchytrium endobioticum]|uniref:Uncharacterized protein n=1 Tax=Synchytrium endobioticum TaxID=286115 RepID=A0A507CJC5_9FUNG|nr:hypothetical protein SeMB42_g06853 [Synchytrium endobioticum]